MIWTDLQKKGWTYFGQKLFLNEFISVNKACYFNGDDTKANIQIHDDGENINHQNVCIYLQIPRLLSDHNCEWFEQDPIIRFIHVYNLGINFMFNVRWLNNWVNLWVMCIICVVVALQTAEIFLIIHINGKVILVQFIKMTKNAA